MQFKSILALYRGTYGAKSPRVSCADRYGTLTLVINVPTSSGGGCACVSLPAMRETVRDSGWDELSDTSLMCKV